MYSPHSLRKKNPGRTMKRKGKKQNRGLSYELLGFYQGNGLKTARPRKHSAEEALVLMGDQQVGSLIKCMD